MLDIADSPKAILVDTTEQELEKMQQELKRTSQELSFTKQEWKTTRQELKQMSQELDTTKSDGALYIASRFFNAKN